ncbi:reverse transcriptase [Gossypium australe]|uniref:Reverse transcriptase n=1 Tax=Gossypium australe TaxID=47621 RepID=A0A5B6WPY6_9ROSI|nr:reverse transcriptase [Gossypium australe]
MKSIFAHMIKEGMDIFMDDFSVYGDSSIECLGTLVKRVLSWDIRSQKKKRLEVDRANVKVIEKLSPRLHCVESVVF